MRSRAWVTAASVMVVGLVVAATPAVATSVDDEGLWYFDRFKVQDAHDEGITGKGVTIALIDRAVNLDLPTLADADIRVQDAPCVRADGSRPPVVSDSFEEAGHGTAALSLLVGSGEGFPGQTGVKGMAPDATVLYYSVQDTEVDGFEWDCPLMELRPGQYNYEFGPMGVSDELELAMFEAMDAGADIISISMTGAEVQGAVARAIREDVIIVAGQANEDQFSIGDSPGGDNGVVSVNSARPDASAHMKDYTDVTAPGYDILVQGGSGGWEEQQLVDGTSLATPIVAGNLALAMQKYPDATPNQLLQSLIHNTGADPHELSWDATFGYGVVITDVFLAADPTVYPDVNPFIHNIVDMWPTVDQIWEGATVNEDLSIWDPRPWPIYTPEPEAEGAPSTPGVSPTPGEGPAPHATPSEVAAPDDGGPGWLIPGIIIGLLLLVAVGITVTMVVIRSNRPAGGSHGTE